MDHFRNIACLDTFFFFLKKLNFQLEILFFLRL